MSLVYHTNWTISFVVPIYRLLNNYCNSVFLALKSPVFLALKSQFHLQYSTDLVNCRPI